MQKCILPNLGINIFGSASMMTMRKRNVESAVQPISSPTIEPNKSSKLGAQKSKSSERSKWTPNAQRILLAISVVAFLLRFFLINEPAEVVFDEVHFGGFASNYIRREYFFDVHPPLGKLMIAGVGWLFGYDGGFTFAEIGQSYANSTAPYVALRTFMVVLSVLSIVLSYATLIEMGFSLTSATFATALLIFDNALVIQSRFILLDSPLMFFISVAVFSWVKFRQQGQDTSSSWWLWLIITGVAIGGATSVKMVGLFTVGLIGVATILDLWGLADWKKQLSDHQLAKHFTYRVIGLIMIPLIVYLGSYWVHFKVLSKTGTGDTFMSPAFQAQLEGNHMHELSRDIYIGHTIRLKSRLEEIYLHSHDHKYPKVHDDGKVSSEGQQVTGYPAKDKNNLWKILPANQGEKISHNSQVQIKDGDLIRLLHVGTGKVLFTHDVASPLTRTNMEITVVEPNDEERYKSTLWRVEIKSGGDKLKALSCQFKLIHEEHKVALTNYQQPLPKWGFAQREINGDKRGVAENSKWIVQDVEEEMSEDEKAAIAKKPKPRMTFLEKYVELQRAQIKHNAGLIDNHPFKSDPLTWPFVLRGVSYWDKSKMGRIYLLGNPIGWYICIIGLGVFCITAVKELYRERRGIKSENQHAKGLLDQIGFLLLAWALHYLPFFTMARTLYLHHYLPAFTLSALVTGATFDYYFQKTKKKTVAMAIIIVLTAAAIMTYFYFSSITYGTTIPTVSLESKKWMKSWDWP